MRRKVLQVALLCGFTQSEGRPRILLNLDQVNPLETKQIDIVKEVCKITEYPVALQDVSSAFGSYTEEFSKRYKWRR